MLNAAIISADSRQIYQYMDIGTSKVSVSDQKMIKHYMIDLFKPGQVFSAGKFEYLVDEILKNEFINSNYCIVCGGTAFYIDSLLNGLDKFPEIKKETLIGLQDDLEKLGLNILTEELKSADPELAAITDLNNPRRVIRALSIFRQTGKAPSEFFKKRKKELPFKPILIVLLPNREDLYERINQRVDQMMKAGLEEEALFIYKNYPQQFSSTVGYAEFGDYFNGSSTLEKSIELIKRNTRRYAKRQMTWFRNRKGWRPFHPKETEAILNYIKEEIHFTN